MTRGALLLGVALAASGCTLSAGDWFADLRATFEAQYAPRADRDAGDGWQKLNTLYQVRMTRALVTIEDIQLQDLGGGSAGAAFDPAHPPPGYSLCHNGHCHRDDGALVPYDEIAAEIAGGGTAAIETVVSLPIGQSDLLVPARRDLACEPQCGLPEARVQRARATLVHVAFEGLVREGRLPARLTGEIPWRWEAALAADTGREPIHLDCAADLPADNAHPPNVRLDLTLEIGARLLDDVEWSALAADAGVVDLAAVANAAGLDLVLHNLAESELSAAIQRTD
jgi:hypothetical protein